MSSDVLLGQYPKQQCVRDRNYAALLRWAAGTAAQALPPAPPDEVFVRNMIMASRIPDQIDSYVQRTLSWFVMDPATVAQIHDFLNAFNTEDLEDQLSNVNGSILAAFMPKFGLSDVSDEQVAQWLAEHYPAR